MNERMIKQGGLLEMGKGIEGRSTGKLWEESREREGERRSRRGGGNDT